MMAMSVISMYTPISYSIVRFLLIRYRPAIVAKMFPHRKNGIKRMPHSRVPVWMAPSPKICRWRARDSRSPITAERRKIPAKIIIGRFLLSDHGFAQTSSTKVSPRVMLLENFKVPYSLNSFSFLRRSRF